MRLLLPTGGAARLCGNDVGRRPSNNMQSVKAVVIIILTAASTVTAQDSPLVRAARAGKRPPFVAASFNSAPELHAVAWYNSPGISITKSRGRVLFLDFWTTWCASCVYEQPKVAELEKRFESRGLVTLLVHDRQTHYFQIKPGAMPKTVTLPAEAVLPKFIAERHLSLPVVVAGAKDFAAYGVDAVPHYFLIDKAGRVRYDSPGKLPTVAEIEALLSE